MDIKSPDGCLNTWESDEATSKRREQAWRKSPSQVQGVSENPLLRYLQRGNSALEGEYNQNNIAMGVPAVLDDNGLTKIIELKLNTEEQAEFLRSAEMVQTDISNLPH